MRYALFFLCLSASAEIPFDLYSESPRGCWARRGINAEWTRDEAAFRLRLRGLPPHDSVRATSEVVMQGGRRERIEWVIAHTGAMIDLVWPEVDVSQVKVEAIAARRAIDIARDHPAGAVIFYATEGVPSHAFVSFQREDLSRRQTLASAAGFYPDPSIGMRQAATRPVRGVIRDDMKATSALPRAVESLTVLVDAGQLRAAETVVGNWRCRAAYRLLREDCVTFIDDVARVLEIPRPERSWRTSRPIDWVRRLITLN